MWRCTLVGGRRLGPGPGDPERRRRRRLLCALDVDGLLLLVAGRRQGRTGLDDGSEGARVDVVRESGHGRRGRRSGRRRLRVLGQRRLRGHRGGHGRRAERQQRRPLQPRERVGREMERFLVLHGRVRRRLMVAPHVVDEAAVQLVRVRRRRFFGVDARRRHARRQRRRRHRCVRLREK